MQSTFIAISSKVNVISQQLERQVLLEVKVLSTTGFTSNFCLPNKVVLLPSRGEGGGLPYETDGDARRLA